MNVRERDEDGPLLSPAVLYIISLHKKNSKKNLNYFELFALSLWY